RHLFPDLQLGPDDIIDRWAGVRPLLNQSGAESKRSREHLLLREGVVLTIAGGKLTTYRAMAEEAVDMLGEMLGVKLPASRTGELGVGDTASAAGGPSPRPAVRRRGSG